MSAGKPALSLRIPGAPKTKENSKACPDCKIDKLFSDYYKNKHAANGMQAYCKDCTKRRNREHYQNNEEYRLSQLRLKKKQYDEDPSVKIRINKRNLARYHAVVKNDPRAKLDWNIATEIRKSMKAGVKNGRSWESLVGYTVDELMSHLQSLFQDGMTWDNHGEWHIDHVKPKSSFSYKSASDREFIECWFLSNLQPLWAHDNLTKHARVI